MILAGYIFLGLNNVEIFIGFLYTLAVLLRSTGLPWRVFLFMNY